MSRVSGTSRLLVVVGDPVRHSLSPAMHNAAIAALGLDAVYVPLHVTAAGLPALIALAPDAGLAGNVTVPHKLDVATRVQRLTPAAKAIGAVNTFWVESGAVVGDNTDIAGVGDALRALDAPGPWLVAGTGGSARAVAAAARDEKVPLLVRSRSPDRARTFVAWARELGADAHVDDGRAAGTAINATPQGLGPSDPPPIPRDRLDGCAAVLDLVYRPGETAWVKACRAAGLRAADGRGMLVGQGTHAFERFFPGVMAPRDIMRAAVEAALR